MTNKFCKNCNNNFENGNDKIVFCSLKCKNHYYYLNNKDRIKIKVREWEDKNPERKKAISKKAFDKFMSTKRERYNELMRNYYKRNRNKWDSRTYTYYLYVNNKLVLEKKCKICSSNQNLEIHHEFYPVKFNDIKRAVKDGKIYFLCSKHHNQNHHLL